MVHNKNRLREHPLFHSIFVQAIFLFLILLIFGSFAHSVSAATGVGLNGRWFTYDGVPTYLVGFDAQELATNPNINYTAKLDLFSQYKINKVRLWTYVWFGSPSFAALTPWAKDANGKHNLDQWNQAYWTRVKDFIAKARDRKIVVEISIFAPYPAASWWWNNGSIAWNKSNNLNGAFSTNSSGHFQPQFFDLNYSETSNSGKKLRDYQQALVDKVIAEFGVYDNVYFEVMNEFGTYKLDVNQWYPWQLNWSKRIRSTSPRLVSVYAGGGGETYSGSLYWNEPSIDVLTIRSLDSPQGISDMLHSAQLKGKALSLNETTGNYFESSTNLDTHTQYAWGMFMSGGYVGIYQDVSSNIGDSSWVTMASRLKALREIAEKANFSTLSPVDSAGNEYDSLVTQGPSGTNWQVLANPSSGYVVYFWGSKSSTAAKIQLPSGNYTYEWYSVLNGVTPIGSGTVSGGGTRSITVPSTSSWSTAPGLVLLIKASSDTTAPSTPTNLSANAVSASQINLSWSASTDNVGVTGYNLYRNGAQIASIANTSYNDTGLSSNTTYTYKIAATDATGNISAQSSQVSATTQGALPSGNSDLSVNGHWLYSGGNPFLWVGDTAWYLMHTTSSKADTYLADRQSKGFTVIQAGALGWGVTSMNVANDDGITPFVSGAMDVGATRNAAYWNNITNIINNAKNKGIHIALLPTNANSAETNTAILKDTTTAYNYGYFLGSTFTQSNVIWILGGDSNITYTPLQPLTRALARGIADGNAGLSSNLSRTDSSRNFNTTIMTFHTSGTISQSSSMVYNSDPWLDFNMIQTHYNDDEVYTMVKNDYQLNKPVLMGEGAYEFAGNGANAYTVRQEAYRSYMAGGYYTFGTFGSTGSSAPCCNSSVNTNLNTSGANSMSVFKNLLSSRGWYNYAPDQSVILSGAGSGANLNTAVIKGNTSAMVYLSNSGSNVSINMSRIGATGNVRVTRVNPVDGSQSLVGDYTSSGSRSFNTGGLSDAIILLDAVTPTPDTTLPSVSLTSPTSGTTVSGTVTISASATDNVGVVGVQFKLDGANLGGEDTTSPYSVSWNTTSATNGTHTLTAVARDAAGNQRTSTGVGVTVNNTTTTYALSMSTSPNRSSATALLGKTVSGNMYVFTTPDTGVSSVSFYLDDPARTNTPWRVESLAPYDFMGTAADGTANAFNTNSIANGQHNITVAIGLASGATQIISSNFTVSNGDTTAPSTPTNLSATAVSSSQINLSWTASIDNVGVAGYDIYRNNVFLTTVTGTAYSNTGLASNTTYSYYVRAKDATGNISTQSTSASAVTQSVSSTNPVGWWKLDDASGTTAFDSSGNGNTGTLVNGPTWTTGRISGGLNFDGVNDYMIAGVNKLPAVNAPQSISVWYRVPTNTDGQNLVVLRAPNSSAANQVMITANGNIAVTQFGGAVTVQAPAPAAGSWHLFTWTWDGTTHRLYINGSQAATATTALQSGPLEQVYLGTYNGTRGLLTGALDDVRVYNRALSATEVQQLFTAAAPIPTPTISLSASVTSVTSGSSSTLSWSSTNTTSCSASGGWSGTKATSGSQTLTNLTTTGTYTLSCTGSGGTTSRSVTITVSAASDTTAPSTPTNLTATAVSTSQINLTWSASTDPTVSGQVTSGVTGYDIYRNNVFLTTVTGTAYSNTGLASNTTYSYYVRAKDAVGNISTQSTSASAVTQTSTPTLTLTANPTSVTSGNSATLTWSSANTTSCTASGGWTGTKTTAGTQTITNITTTKTYTLSCTGAGGTTSKSVTITATTAPDTTLPTVSITSPTSGTTVSGTVSVSASATDNVGVAGVQFKLDGANLGGEDTTSPYSVSWNTTSATNGTHTLTAVARDQAGNQRTATIVTVTVSNVTPDTTLPTLSIITPSTTGSYATQSPTVTISGTASDNTGVTQVSWDSTQGGQGVALGTTTWTISPLSLQTGINTITVTAKDAAGNTATQTITVTYTAQTIDTTAPSTPINLTASGISTSQISLSWSASTDNVGVTGYQVYRGGTLLTTVSNTSYTDTNLSVATAYAYTVSAFDAAGNASAQSSPVAATTQTTTTPPPPPQLSAPTTPGNFSVSGSGTTEVTLTWSPSSDDQGVSGYQIYRNGTYLTTVTGTSYTDTNLSPQTTYLYTVTAVDAQGISSTPSTPLTTITERPETTPSPVPGTTTPTAPSQTFATLTGPFSIGMENAQVKLLQEMLKRDGSFTADATGYYGPITQRAVETFQIKYGIVTSGTPNTTGFGLAGPGTRAKLNALYAGPLDEEALVASLRKQVADLTAILQTLIAKLAALKAAQGVQ